MAEVARYLALEETRAFSIAGARDRLRRGFVHPQEIVSVNLDTRHVEALGALSDISDCDGVPAGRRFRVAVVLDNENTRQFPNCREIQTFQRGALVGAPISDEADRNVLSSEFFGGKPGSAYKRRPDSHDPVGAHHALTQIRDMHGAAFTSADSALFAVDFGCHGPEVATLRDAMAVAPVRAGDAVSVAKMHAHSGGDGFLAGI